jgi:hypothetical protein
MPEFPVGIRGVDHMMLFSKGKLHTWSSLSSAK